MTEIIAIFNDASKGQDSLATLSFAKKGLLQNHKRQATVLSYFVIITHLKDVSRLKGAICGNPTL